MIDDSSKNTISFCLEFTRTNLLEHSQNSQCRVWLKTVLTILDGHPEISSQGFMMSEIEDIDKFLSGSNSSLTSNDIYSKLEMVETLLKDL